MRLATGSIAGPETTGTSVEGRAYGFAGYRNAASVARRKLCRYCYPARRLRDSTGLLIESGLSG